MSCTVVESAAAVLPVYNPILQLLQKVKVQGINLTNVEEYLLAGLFRQYVPLGQLGRLDGTMDNLPRDIENLTCSGIQLNTKIYKHIVW